MTLAGSFRNKTVCTMNKPLKHDGGRCVLGQQARAGATKDQGDCSSHGFSRKARLNGLVTVSRRLSLDQPYVRCRLLPAEHAAEINLPCSVPDEQDYNNDGTQSDCPIGNLNARQRCFLVKPFRDFPPNMDWQHPTTRKDSAGQKRGPEVLGNSGPEGVQEKRAAMCNVRPYLDYARAIGRASRGEHSAGPALLVDPLIAAALGVILLGNARLR